MCNVPLIQKLRWRNLALILDLDSVYLCLFSEYQFIVRNNRQELNSFWKQQRQEARWWRDGLN